MFTLYIQTFITLFFIIDPIALAPLFAGLTQHLTNNKRNQVAKKACFISALLLLLFSFGGEGLLKLMDISDAAFQISGGVLLMIAAVEMVVAHHTGMTTTIVTENQEAHKKRDIAVFPLSIPLIAGPGALTTVVLFMQEAEGDFLRQFIMVCIIFFVIGITFLFLRMAFFLQKLLGVTGTNVVTRVFGIVLAALATQFILSGLNQAFFCNG